MILRKADFWLLIVVWYVLLSIVLVAGFSRFGSDYMLQMLADPSAKVIAFLAMFLLPIPLIWRGKM